MLATIDTETYEKDGDGNYVPKLDASGKSFILGCLLKETGGHKTFYDKDLMWEYIKELGLKEFKRGKKLTIYAHNSRYECWQLFDFNDKNIKIFSESPFIAGYYHKIEKTFDTKEKFESWQRWAKMNKQYYKIEAEALGVTTISYRKEIIKFLDTMALYRMSLKKMGEIIGVPKLEMPMELGKRLSRTRLKELEKYCLNDCKVSLEGVKFIQKKLKENKINIRNLCTINQIAISWIINELIKGNNEHILYKNNEGKLTENTWKTYFAKDIHEAYRGGYVRVWKTGFIKGITQIDFNSLYPHSAMVMDFPDLRTEKKIQEPLKSYKVDRLLENIGISKCMIYNESDDLGLLMVRTGGKSYSPKKGKYMIGVWTNIELKEALKNGYKIIDIEWSILYEKGSNPFKDIFGRLYKLRKKSNDRFNNYFYKMIMNAGIGKFAQTKTNQEIFVDSIEKTYEYLKLGCKRIGNIENSDNVVYVNGMDKTIKKYYAPIISTLITAQARVIMYNNYKKIPIEDLCYSDTDSILFTGNHIKKFELGNELGQFKIEDDIVTGEPLIKTNGIIWGTKCKAIGNNIGVSGVYKPDLNLELFKEGKVYAKRMCGIKNLNNKNVGEFIIEERNLKKQLEDFNKVESILKSQMLYIDNNCEDVSFFGNKLKNIDDLDVLLS